MAIPVINPATSILSYKQWHDFEVQPWATNEPDEWGINGYLPEGVNFDEATGKITGPGSKDSIVNFELKAHNADGWSAPLPVTMRITPSAAPLASTGYEIIIDATTREAKLIGGEIIYVAAGDDLLLFLKFQKGDNVIAPSITQLTISFRELALETTIIESSKWKQFGTGTGAFFVLHAKFAKEKLVAALSNWDTDKGQRFTGTAQIEWIESYEPAGWEDAPPELRMTTRQIPILIEADFGEGTSPED